MLIFTGMFRLDKNAGLRMKDCTLLISKNGTIPRLKGKKEIEIREKKEKEGAKRLKKCSVKSLLSEDANGVSRLLFPQT